MIQRIAKLLRHQVPVAADEGLLYASGAAVPTAATRGYQTGCIFHHTDGGAGTALYINEGTFASCSFAAVAALSVSQEALIAATPGAATASTAVILDANAAIDAVKTAALSVGASGAEVPVILGGGMAPGTGISTGTGTVCKHSVVKTGGIYKTEILIDVTGLHGGLVADEIIGVDGGTANCHIGQILAAINGTIIHGQITCIETPVGGDPDIDFYGSADEATGAQDGALTTITGEELLLNNGDWSAAAAPVALTALPDADGYLYMVQGAATDVEYSAGIFLIELWGV